MGGCFGPRKNRTLVYLDLLQQIYAEGAKVELHQVRGSPAYDLICDRLTKKGLMKKLVEHLSSHRNYLNDCAQANWRLMSDSNTFNSKVTGLVVSNNLIHNLEAFEAVILQPRQASHGVLTPKIERRGNPREDVLTIGSGVDFRFENTIFRQALDLYDNEPSLRERVLEALSEFALFKQGKLTCDRLVVALLGRLHRDIRMRCELFTQTCKTFGDVLKKSNDSIDSMESNAQALTLFLSIWVEEEDDVVTFYCENVIGTYLERCLTTHDYGFIFSVLFLVYDHYGFDEPVLKDLEDKLLEMIGEEDLKLQFVKGMFRYLLTYLAVTSNNHIMARWQHGVFEVHYQTLKTRYNRVLNRQSKLFGLKTLYRWMNRGQLNLNELIDFNRDSLASCFVFNILSYSNDKEQLTAFVRTFYSICNRIQTRCVCRLFEFMLEEVFHIDETTVEPGSVLIRVCCDLLEKYKVIDGMEDIIQLKPLTITQPHRTRLELLYMYSVILRECTTPLNPVMVDSLAQVLYSLYGNFSTKETLQQKLMTLGSMYPLFLALHAHGEVELLLVFDKRLENTHGSDFLATYLQRYFSTEIHSLLEGKDCVPRQIKQLNRLISIGDPNAEQEIYKYVHSSSALWTSRASGQISPNKNYPTSTKKLEMLQRQFEREGSAYESRVPVQIHIQDRNKNSVVSETIRGDESLEYVFGLIRDGGGRRFDQKPASKIQRIRTSRNL